MSDSPSDAPEVPDADRPEGEQHDPGDPGTSASGEGFHRVGEARETHEEEVQPEGVDAIGILWIGLYSVIVLVIVVLLSIVMVERQMIQTEQAVSDRAQYPLKERVQREAQERLTGYGTVPDREGRFRIPIERAMDEVAERYGSDGEAE